MQFNLYYSPQTLELFSRVYKIERAYMLDANKRGANLPLFRSKYSCINHDLFNLPFQFYQTSHYFQDIDLESLWDILCSISKETKKNISINTIGEIPLQNSQHVAYNCILPLNDTVDFRSQYTRSHRGNIRTEWNKAARKQVRVEISRNEHDLKQFYNILAKQYVKTHKMLFQPYTLFKGFWDAGVAYISVAKDKDQVIGGALLLLDGEVLHYNWGARSSLGNLSIGTLVIDYAIQYAYENGFRYFDFGSTPLTDTELLEYKLKWGCKSMPVYNYATLFHPPLLDLNSSCMLLRNLYSAMPVSLLKQIMPYVVPLVVN